MKIFEILDASLSFKVIEASDSYYVAAFKAGDRTITFQAGNEETGYGFNNEGEWTIEFAEVKSSGNRVHYKTGSGNEFAVFATLKNIISDFIEKCNPTKINFSADKDSKNNRGRLYASLFKRNLPKGWKLDVDNNNDLVSYFQAIKESLNKVLDFKITKSEPKEFTALFTAGNRDIEFTANYFSGAWELQFAELLKNNNSRDTSKLTGSGNEFEVFATIKNIIDKFIKDYNPSKIIIDSFKGEANRANLYQRIIRKSFSDGWKLDRDDNHPSYTTFVLTKK